MHRRTLRPHAAMTRVCSRIAIAGVLALVVVAGSPSGASAHAILLQTSPFPQSTTTSIPTSVRLFFSEPVELAFGSVRVYDVNGDRVDTGKITRIQGNKGVVVGLHDVQPGTYTVTWRAVSADGHGVHGGFVFYVFAPSTTPPKGIKAEEGAGVGVTWGYGVVRFLWFAAFIAIVGLISMRRWVWTPAIRAGELAGTEQAARFRRRFARALPVAWGLLVLAGGVSLWFQAASVSGLSLWSSINGTVLSDVLGTTYGHFWIVSMSLSVVAAIPVSALARGRTSRPEMWFGGLAVVMIGLAVLTGLSGHARTLRFPGLAVPSITVHLLAVSMWVGGLATLVALAGPGWRSFPDEKRAPLLRDLIRRFGWLGYGSVIVIIVTGTVNSITAFASITDLWKYAYGRVVLAKIALLVVALVLAARHRYRVPVGLSETATADSAARGFTRTSAVETVVLAVVVALAAGLVALVPGRSLSIAATSGPLTQARTSNGYQVQLLVDPGKVGANEIHFTYFDSRGLGAQNVLTGTATLGLNGATPKALDLRLLVPGHFVADATLEVPGRYRIRIVTGKGSPAIDVTFDFKI